MFTVVHAGVKFKIEWASWGRNELERYEFSVARKEFDEIFPRRKILCSLGATFDSVDGDSGCYS